uniref:ABC transporter domain-containing protein n=1 Tax=Steinernema glaseri TaxID=37863 RepID=A0A1I7YP24_9BILA
MYRTPDRKLTNDNIGKSQLCQKNIGPGSSEAPVLGYDHEDEAISDDGHEGDDEANDGGDNVSVSVGHSKERLSDKCTDETRRCVCLENTNLLHPGAVCIGFAAADRSDPLLFARQKKIAADESSKALISPSRKESSSSGKSAHRRRNKKANKSPDATVENVTYNVDSESEDEGSDRRRTLPPVDPLVLSWEHLIVRTDADRLLLNDISGIAQPGQLLALMGASGAGKTTLLNTLLQRNLRGLKVTGEILVNGREVGRGITTISSYVQQEDLFVGTLTVSEHLNIQAHLRLPPGMSSEEKRERVEQVIDEMGLRKSVGSRIGVAGVKKGISGGEAKRLSFASEILTNPAILFCDEPTTGLDSFMARSVVKTLTRLASEGNKTIVCTIHQPASEVFELFDRVLFLAAGKPAFLGSPDEAIYFFGDCGLVLPEHCNPADLYIDQLAMVPGEEEECTQRIDRITALYEKSCYNQRMQYESTKIFTIDTPLEPRECASLTTITYNLFKRSLLDTFRNPSLARAKIVQKVMMGIFLGLLYWQTDMDQEGLINLKGALFYYISELTYTTVFGIQTFMPADFPLVVREYHDGIYPVASYYLSKVVAYLPLFTLDGFMMVGASYFMIGLNANALVFLRTILICMLVEWSAASVGIMISAIAPSYSIAVSVSGPLLTIFSLTGGLYTNVNEMPPYVSWVQYLSWFRFGYESLIVNQFENYPNISCAVRMNPPVGQNITFAPKCEGSGEEVISNLEFNSINLTFNMVIMFLYVIAANLIGYVGLVRRVMLAR